MTEKTERSYLSSCPVCGRTLFRGTPDSCIEVGCPKCKEYLEVKFYDTGYQVCIRDRQREPAPCMTAETRTTS